MIVTIHQPEHLVWLGLIDKISQADVFVVLDTVQFEKNYFQNRNKIRTPYGDGWSWLTVPIKKHSLHTKIKDIEISYVDDWHLRYLDILRLHYKKAPHFDTYYGEIESRILKKYLRLADLNLDILTFMLSSFGVEGKKIILASGMNLPEPDKGGSNTVLEICKALDTEAYLSGPSGRDYLNLNEFKEVNVGVRFHEFHHPEYRQLFEPFLPYMSSIDLLFNHGKESKNILFHDKK